MIRVKSAAQSPNWPLLGLIGLGFALRLYQLDRNSLWFDEIVITFRATLPLMNGLYSLLGGGMQLLPLEQWITKAWLVVGNSDWLVRFPPVIFGVLTIPMMYKLGRSYFAERVGLFAAVLLTINPFQIWYAQENRSYSLLILASIGAMYAFVNLLRHNSRTAFWQLVFFHMLGFNAHYFMFLISTCQFVFLAIHLKRYHRLLKLWLLSQVIAALMMVPWWYFLLTHSQHTVGTGWIQSPTLLDFWLTFLNFTIGYQERSSLLLTLATLIVSLAFIIGLITVGRMPARYRLILIWVWLPIVVVWILSLGSLSFYVDRYFLIITPALMLILAAGVTSQPNPAIRTSFGLALVLAMSFGLSQIYFNPAYFTKDDWRSLAHQVSDSAQPGDGLVTCGDSYRLSLDYYGLGDIFNEQAKAGEVYYVYPGNFDFNAVLANYNRLWVVTTNPRRDQHHIGYAYPLVLDRTRLPKAEAVWLDQYPPQNLTVAGITTFLYDLEEKPDLNQLVQWSCSGE